MENKNINEKIWKTEICLGYSKYNQCKLLILLRGLGSNERCYLRENIFQEDRCEEVNGMKENLL